MNIKLKKIIHFLISLPISIWINFKVFPFRTAILLPIIIDYRTSIYGHGLQKGSIILPAKFNFGLIKIGWGNGSLGNPHNKRNYIIISGKGKLIFNGKTQFAMMVLYNLVRILELIKISHAFLIRKSTLGTMCSSDGTLT